MQLSPSAHVDTFARDHLPPFDQWPQLEFATPDLQYPDRLNAAGELIDVAVSTYGPDRPAIRTDTGELWTYGDLQRRANQVAQVLVEDLGLVPGNRVPLRSPNNPWAVAAWLGVLKAGGIAVVTMCAPRSRELTPLVGRSRPTIALVDHRYTPDVEEVRGAARPELVVVPVGGGSGDDLVASTAPFASTSGLGMLLVFPLRAGACMFLVEAATPARLVELVGEHRITVLATAPTAYRRILESGNQLQLRTLRSAVSGGEHIPEQVWGQLEAELGLRVIDGIGATELLHVLISAAGDDIRPGATGRPVPGYRATILDVDGAELPAGVEGRLAVIGPVGCRYLDDDRQRNYVVNGWNVTGDTSCRDEDGYFSYCARTDDMIVSSATTSALPRSRPPSTPTPTSSSQPWWGSRTATGGRSCARSWSSVTRGRGRREGQGDPGPRQAAVGPVQVPARRPVPPVPAAQLQRQAPAPRPAQQLPRGGKHACLLAVRGTS
jgi:2-aminobenzoate-CoA ligase